MSTNVRFERAKPNLVALKRRSVVDNVAKQIAELILRSNYRPGDQLPTENELSESLGVSRASVREALRSVAAHRMIESRAGAGYFLCEQQPETMFDRMVVPSLLAEDTMRNLQEVRMVIEVAAIALASQRASEDDLLALEMTWATMASDPNYQPLALRFHELIIAAAHNPVMSSLYGVISSGIIEYIDERYQAGRTREQELDSHRCLLDAIKSRDTERAQAAMSAHLRQVSDVLGLQTTART